MTRSLAKAADTAAAAAAEADAEAEAEIAEPGRQRRLPRLSTERPQLRKSKLKKTSQLLEEILEGGAGGRGGGSEGATTTTTATAKAAGPMRTEAAAEG